MNSPKEAQARIKINKLLEEAGWRFLSDKQGHPANIQLEPSITIKEQDINSFGDDFEHTKRGFVDFLLLDKRGFPLAVVEAKRESKDPLDGKEQARKYAKAQNVRFVILSNGNSHYFWDLEDGSPDMIITFPNQQSLIDRSRTTSNKKGLADEKVEDNYIALGMKPRYKKDPRYQDKATREEYLREEKLPILRPYQLEAVWALQQSAKKGNDRFLFEMATGTGKTLIAAAIIRLFFLTGNAKRILFLVDRIELEEQAHKNFVNYLKQDCTSVIYKQNRDDWRSAEVVISTVQSFSSDSKYKKLFTPIDFDLVISDEAHRSISGNSRAVFEYFTGYKLGLTATPKDYLKNIDAEQLSQQDPRAWERRQLLDTYKTFGCESGEPTFRYTVLDGVQNNYLVNPTAVDARTDITTQLLSDKGLIVMAEDEEGEEVEERVSHRDFEKKFFSENTNRVFCRTLIENAIQDPLSGEIGKTIIFCISQKHANKIAQILNKMADQIWPDKYNSDFAVQVTSNVQNSQQMTINFANNKLNGYTKFLPNYESSKTRICVTVGMMTTGYDCEDILNLALMRPVFSPTDFIQMKGRGTRKFVFKYEDEHGEVRQSVKERFKFFDFFANFEYFEDKYDYDEVLKLPTTQGKVSDDPITPAAIIDEIEIFTPDKIKHLTETPIGPEGMKVDRKLFEKASEKIRQDQSIEEAVMSKEWDKAVKMIKDRYENKPEFYLTLEKIRKYKKLDRPLTWREVLEHIFGFINSFKSKEEKLEDEADRFISIEKPESQQVPYVRNFLKAYIADETLHEIIESGQYGRLNVYPGFSAQEFGELRPGLRDAIQKYVKDYVLVEQYRKK